jgi:hypothetical protein
VIEDSVTAAPPAAIPPGAGNGAQPTVDTSRVNEDESAIATGSTVTENAARRLP